MLISEINSNVSQMAKKGKASQNMSDPNRHITSHNIEDPSGFLPVGIRAYESGSIRVVAIPLHLIPSPRARQTDRDLPGRRMVDP